FSIHRDGIAIDATQTVDKVTPNKSRDRQHDQNDQSQLPRHVEQHGDQSNDDQGFTDQDGDDFGGKNRDVSCIDGKADKNPAHFATLEFSVELTQESVKHVTPQADQHVIGHPGKQV